MQAREVNVSDGVKRIYYCILRYGTPYAPSLFKAQSLPGQHPESKQNTPYLTHYACSRINDNLHLHNIHAFSLDTLPVWVESQIRYFCSKTC